MDLARLDTLRNRLVLLIFAITAAAIGFVYLYVVPQLESSLTAEKLRRLELTAGAPKYAKTARGTWSSNDAIRQAERELAAQAEASYKRLVKDQQAGAPARNVGASATPERA